MQTVIRDLMSVPPVVCGPKERLGEAAAAMSAAGVGSVVVVEDAKVVGIVTERDLLRCVAAGADPVAEP